MRFGITQYAPDGELFTGDVFASQIGKTIPVVFGEHRTMGKVIAVKVAPNRRSATVTVETEDPCISSLLGYARPGSYSIRAMPARRRG